MTMNSPESLHALHELVSADGDLKTAVKHAEEMREVGLKCIGFNGVRLVSQPCSFRHPTWPWK